MKINIKLSKDEAEAYKNFSQGIKPDELSDQDFMKTIFFKGCETLHAELQGLMQRFAKDNQEELASSGITVVEGDDGEVKLMASVSDEPQEATEEA